MMLITIFWTRSTITIRHGSRERTGAVIRRSEISRARPNIRQSVMCRIGSMRSCGRERLIRVSIFRFCNSLFYQGMDKTTNSQGQITVLGDYKEFGDGAGPDMIVTQVNQGQITNYPYQITTEEQQTLTVAATHYQWLQPGTWSW